MRQFICALARAGACIAFFATDAGAQEVGAGYVEVCLAGAGYDTIQGSNRCPSGQRSWERPDPGDAVLSCGSLATGEACTWFHPELVYRLWEDIPDDMLVQTCAAEIPAGAFGSVDPCGSGGHANGKPRIPKSQVVGFTEMVPRRVTVKWENATERTDGTAIEEGELINTAVYWSRDADADKILAAPEFQQVIVEFPGTQAEIEIPTGVWNFGARHLASCADGEECYSALSNIVTKNVQHIAGAPEGVEVALPGEQLFAGELAYTSVKINDGQVMLPLTEIEPETPCIMDEAIVAQTTVNGVVTRGVLFYAVPVASLIWPVNDATIRPSVVYALCD